MPKRKTTTIATPETEVSAQMKVEMWSIDRPIPYARNARKVPQSAIDKVAASIQEFGWRQPIVVDAKDVIVVGHTRLLGARKLGNAEVPVHVATDLSPAQIKAYRLMDNRSHQETEWDIDLLVPELIELRDIDEIDLSLTGFSEQELLDILAVGEDGEGEKDSDAAGGASRTLADRFGVPPFSVLDARQGYWQDRKRAWLSLGIKSELGRGTNALDMSAAMAGITDEAEREQWNLQRRGRKQGV